MSKSVKVPEMRGIATFLSSQSDPAISVEALQSQIVELQKSQPTTRLDPKLISRCPYQPRKYFSPLRKEQMNLSVREFGVLSNIIVRLVNDTYELVDGECRLISAIEVGCDVPVSIVELSDRDARRIALAANLVRQDLSPVEETWAILNLLAIEFDVQSNDIVKSILINLLNVQRGKVSSQSTDRLISANNGGNNVIASYEQYSLIVERVLAENLCSMKLLSFVNNRLPLLDLPEDILQAIAEGLEPSKAQLISKIKDPEQRADLLRLAVESGISLVQVREQVKSIIAGDADPKPTRTPMTEDRIRSVVNEVISAMPTWDKDKRVEMERLLAKIEALTKVNNP